MVNSDIINLDPDPGKSYGSDRIRIRNTEIKWKNPSGGYTLTLLYFNKFVKKGALSLGGLMFKYLWTHKIIGGWKSCIKENYQQNFDSESNQDENLTH